MNKALVALSFGTFALGIAEFTMMGVLGNVASSLDISISQAGHCITAYATGVAVGAPSLIMVRKWPLKRVLLVLAALITLGNVMAALAPTYHILLIARFISGLPHGAYFGTGAIVAQRLVPPGHGASAVAQMVGGMTLANLFGVPMATFVTNIVSWRGAFAIVAVCALATFVALYVWVPALKSLHAGNFKSQFAFLRKLAPWLILLGTFFGQGSVYCWFSYLDPLMTHVTGFAASDMSWIMVVAGLGMVVGNYAAGKFSDRFNPALVTAVIAASVVIILPLIALGVHSKIASVALTFLATSALFGIGGPLQYLIVRYSRGGEMLGGACIQIAFNVSNAVASTLGGLAIAHGMGLLSPTFIGIPMAAIAASMLFALSRRHQSA